MNKKNNQYVPICFIAGIILCIAIAFFVVKPAFEEYNDASERQKRTVSELQGLDEKMQKEKSRQSQEEMNLKSIKQIYESSSNGNASDNLAVFGTLFDDVIKTAQTNNLFIRSIEYDTKPANNTIYSNFSDQYHVCELKFFLVGKYPQLKTFLNDITGSNFKYLVSISDINITAFNGDTDYILIKLSISLYSKKPIED